MSVSIFLSDTKNNIQRYKITCLDLIILNLYIIPCSKIAFDILNYVTTMVTETSHTFIYVNIKGSVAMAGTTS
jgi:hypothetical protein